jgi:hypothetical protein
MRTRRGTMNRGARDGAGGPHTGLFPEGEGAPWVSRPGSVAAGTEELSDDVFDGDFFDIDVFDGDLVQQGFAGGDDPVAFDLQTDGIGVEGNDFAVALELFPRTREWRTRYGA